MMKLLPRVKVPRKRTYKHRDTGSEACLCCGREVLRYAHTVELDNLDYAISKRESNLTPGDDLIPDSKGVYPIGPDCARWLRKEHPDFYQAYVYA